MKFRLDSYGSSASVAYSGIEGFFSSMACIPDWYPVPVSGRLIWNKPPKAPPHRLKSLYKKAEALGWIELGFSGRRFDDIVAFYDKAKMVVCNSHNDRIVIIQ